MIESERLSDHCAERIAGEMHPLDAKPVEHAGYITREVRHGKLTSNDVRLVVPLQIEAHNFIFVPGRCDLWVETTEIEEERVREGQRRRVFRPVHGHMHVHAVYIQNLLQKSHSPLLWF